MKRETGRETYCFAVGIDARVVQCLCRGNENSSVSPLCLAKTPETSSSSSVEVNCEWSTLFHFISFLFMGWFRQRSHREQVLLVQFPSVPRWGVTNPLETGRTCAGLNAELFVFCLPDLPGLLKAFCLWSVRILAESCSFCCCWSVVTQRDR